MAASLAETSVTHLALPSTGTKRTQKTIEELAPCFTPFGKEKVYSEGSVFELPANKPKNTNGSDEESGNHKGIDVYAIVKKSPDQKRVTAINKILVVPDQSGDEIWVVPEQPGKEDRSKRFRYTVNHGLEISLFNGSYLQVEYNLNTGELTDFVSSEHNQEIPKELPKRELARTLQTMSSLVNGEALELTTMQSLVNFPRDHKLEGF